ncbi:MAG: hypothetical protein AB7H94_29235 [Lautropia sp.]
MNMGFKHSLPASPAASGRSRRAFLLASTSLGVAAIGGCASPPVRARARRG